MSSVLPSNNKLPAATLTVDKPAGRREASQAEAGSAAASPAPTKSAVSELKLSPEAESALRLASFDTRKVESLRSAVAAGNYPLDLDKVAASFAELERML